MSKRVLALAAVFAVVALGARAAEEKKPAAKAAAGGKAVFMPAGDMKWVDAPNSPPGIKIAVVSGDPAKGPFKAFMKLPAGLSAPLHHHDADHYVTVVSGNLSLALAGGEEKKLPQGSYFAFTGKKKHTTKCDAGADCVLFIDAKGPWNVVTAEGGDKGEKK